MCLRAELWAVAGQVKQFDLRALCELGLDLLAVIHAQIFQNQQDLLARVFDQDIKELDQPVRVERLVNNNPRG